MKYSLILGAFLCCCFSFGWTQARAMGISVEAYVESHMAKFRTDDEGLRSIYERQLSTRHAIFGKGGGARDTFFSTPGDPVETQYVLEVLEKAHAQDSKDWATIASALEIAVVGTDEEKVVQLCRDVLESVRAIPDDGGDVVWGASQYLLVKRGQEYTDLVEKCVYADHIGVLNDAIPISLGMEDMNRNNFRRQAIIALLEYLPLRKQVEVFERLSRDHPVEAAAPTTWQESIAIQLSVYRDGAKRKLQEDIPDYIIR